MGVAGTIVAPPPHKMLILLPLMYGEFYGTL
jgi:hypothetical protein